eukprot:907311-Prymnesium_polylepis.2
MDGQYSARRYRSIHQWVLWMVARLTSQRRVIRSVGLAALDETRGVAARVRGKEGPLSLVICSTRRGARAAALPVPRPGAQILSRLTARAQALCSKYYLRAPKKAKYSTMMKPS